MYVQFAAIFEVRSNAPHCILFIAVNKEISEEYIGFEHAIFTIFSPTTEPILITIYLQNSLYF